MEKNTDNWTMVARYLAGEMSAKESNDFLAWTTESSDNTKFFEEVKKDWEKIDDYIIAKEFNVDNAWNKLNNRFENEGLVPQKKHKTIKLNMVFKIAAVALILVGVFVGGRIFSEKKEANISYTANTQGEQIVLADGSRVTLNKNATLTYTSNMDGDLRKVELTGEAFFDVTKNPDKPFVVLAQDVRILVLGTSFNVCTSAEIGNTEVLVSTGKVQVSKIEQTAEKLILTPGEMAMVKKESIRKLNNNNKNYLAWKTKKFVFEDETLAKVAQTIDRAYNSKIIFSNKSIENYKINSTFEKQSIEVIIELICTPFNLKWKKENDTFVIYK